MANPRLLRTMTEGNAPEASGLLDTEWHILSLPWPTAVHAASGPAPRVRWQRIENRLLWEIEGPAPLAGPPAFPPGGFIEGLWEQDVAECFLLDRQTGGYTEYNLSPGGAWWAAEFTAPRIRRDPQPPPTCFGVRLETQWTAAGWLGRMEMRLPSAERFAVNFTAVVMTAEGCCYYSLSPLGGGRPDYHRPQDWAEWV